MSTASRSTAELTLLHRPEGEWSFTDVAMIINALGAEAIQHPKHPEHLILCRHFEEGRVHAVLQNDWMCTVVQVVGTENTALPFTPSFI